MSDTPCIHCTAEEQCAPCKEAYEQTDRIAAMIDTLTPELQTVAMGIILGLHQITHDQTDTIALFISKVHAHAIANPEIKTFLQDMTTCYLTAWEYDLLMRCLQSLNQ